MIIPRKKIKLDEEQPYLASEIAGLLFDDKRKRQRVVNHIRYIDPRYLLTMEVGEKPTQRVFIIGKGRNEMMERRRNYRV